MDIEIEGHRDKVMIVWARERHTDIGKTEKERERERGRQRCLGGGNVFHQTFIENWKPSQSDASKRQRRRRGRKIKISIV